MQASRTLLGISIGTHARKIFSGRIVKTRNALSGRFGSAPWRPSTNKIKGAVISLQGSARTRFFRHPGMRQAIHLANKREGEIA